MEHFLLVGAHLYFATSGYASLRKNTLMHQVHRLITVAQLCQRVLLDVRGIIRVCEVFVQLLGLKFAFK